MRSSRPPVPPLQAAAAARSVSSSSPGGASVSAPTSAASSSRQHQQQQWEDEAWTVDSDDEDFVCRQQQQHLASKAVAAAAAASSASISQKHAPPAQPHPYALPSRTASSSAASGSISSTGEGGSPASSRLSARPGPNRSVSTSVVGPTSSTASSSSSRPAAPHLNSRTSWLLVDRVTSSASSPGLLSSTSSTPGAAPISATPLSAIPTDLDAAIAGSPPTDLGPSAEAAVYNASFLGGSNGPALSPGLTTSSHLVTSDISPLTRVPSSRTKRRWTEFVRALGGVTPPSPAAAIAATNGIADMATADASLSAPEQPQVTVNLDELRKAAWKGVPDELRPMIWMLLLGYLPPQPSARATTLARKRADYATAVEQAFGRGRAGLDHSIWHQIEIDVPRTNPGIPLWQREATQRSLERILYVWALRHPASGYVQGIADLATPFYEVFLSAYIDSDPEQYDVAHLPSHTLQALEADTFWCLSKLLDGIQDNYIFAQPGIQRQVKLMAELVARIDAPLHQHLADQHVQYMQFAFRWMNCLLMREMSVRNIVRMWDTYLAEGPDAFSDFHPFVCAVMLKKWSARLMEMDFQGIIMFLLNLPTKDWSNADAEDLLAQAFMYKSLFGNTAHLR
ncbi:unnamed protein product [Tilletia controversa]|uniref:Rab-GAP TBC domain-containing protein n=3 Tax=Tilletia TaxID=13289 RepID=A0A8X7N1E5_9BASI|nr:hypothetical protein CF336_g272 [Tilletia laevis]KAE8202392.1 hypothetical protein CF328_g2244 [Tilletia controversa]KAE8265540.1 hypothetical protein A4X03_0g191 [Tilletia caries]KAE8206814.1 hypothetical protein CF335_g1599 [Tilletia laevis]KAE8255327.1 hypothetical protein A4X06_0g470 [Tilletia controversa]